MNKTRNRIYKQKYDANEEIKKQKKDRYSSIIGTLDHDAIKKQKRDMYSAIIRTPEQHDDIKKQKCDMYSAIIGTPEHDSIKKQKRDMYSAVIGTAEHDAIKKQKCDTYSAIIGTPEHDTAKKQKRDLSHDLYSAIIGTTQHIARKQQMQSYRRNVTSIMSNSNQRTLKFTKQIQEGPYYICVVCNRCHYCRSVLLFKQEKYDIDIDQFYYEVSSVNGLLYIYGTCHKKLQKSEIPAQSVWNKLGISMLPDELANLNRL